MGSIARVYAHAIGLNKHNPTPPCTLHPNLWEGEIRREKEPGRLAALRVLLRQWKKGEGPANAAEINRELTDQGFSPVSGNHIEFELKRINYPSIRAAEDPDG